MIKSVELKNILSHKHSKLEFHPNVNMIIGKSDKGKSAIITGLLWAMTNRPTGDSFVSWWASTCSSKVTFDNGNVELKRDKQNRYVLNEKEPVLKGFGQTCPEEVSKIVNIDQDINIQRQIGTVPIFLLSNTPGEVAKFFNKVVGIDLIDKTLDNGKRDIKQTERQLSSAESQIKEKQEELALYDGVERLYTKIVNLEKTQQKTNERQDKKQKIKVIIEAIQNIKKDIVNEKKLSILKSKIKKAEILRKKKKALQGKKSELEILVTKSKTIRKEIEEIEKASDLAPTIERILSLLSKISTKREYIKKIKYFSSRIIETKSDIQKETKELERVTKLFNNRFPNVCPLCGEERNENKKK